MTGLQQARSATARRLTAAFVAILLLFGAALAVELSTLHRIGEAEALVARLDHAKHAGHTAAAQVREQYIHQAHTLIEFDTSHLDHYEEAVISTRRATEHLEAMAETEEERALAREIARLARENDEEFRAQVVPAVRRGDRRDLVMLGERLEATVDEVVDLNEALNLRLEARSDAARARADALRAQARRITVAIFAFAILLAAVVGVWLTRSILRPVAALRAGVRRVGSGDLGARIEVESRDEFGELAAAFNAMAGDLGRQQAELVRAQKLASIGQVAAGVAHEINNPLFVILGHVKLLRRQAPDGGSEELRTIEEEAHACHRIVQGLLDLARPQTLELEVVDLAVLAREAVERLDEAGRLEDRRVTTPAAGVSAPASGDAGKLRQVIANVVLNAAQALPAGGRVVVEAGASGDETTVSVQDDGPGMPADVRARIFDPFFTTKREGTGLGLSIAQAIVDAHGGRLEVDSTPGQGTRVTLRLPRASIREERP